MKAMEKVRPIGREAGLGQGENGDVQGSTNAAGNREVVDCMDAGVRAKQEPEPRAAI